MQARCEYCGFEGFSARFGNGGVAKAKSTYRSVGKRCENDIPI